MKHKTLFTTERGQRHQQHALDAAPLMLDVTMLRQPERATMLAHLPETEYLISERTGKIDAEMIGAAPNLKLILRIGSLTHDIDVGAAQTADVHVCTWPSGGVIRVAEHVMAQMLVLLKSLQDAATVATVASPGWGESRRTDEDTFAYNWSRRTSVESLWGATVGIVGFGEIGVELARWLSGWDCAILYSKRRRLPELVESVLGIRHADVETVFRESDIIVNLLPYFPETDRWLDNRFFQQMKHGAYLVSCGSGSVINEADLAAAVENGHLAGVALDTFEWEPIQANNPLVALALDGHNVLLTPHIAAGASAKFAGERSREYTNIINHIDGLPLRYQIV